MRERRQLSGALEVIRRLGASRAGVLKVKQGRRKAGESPIYYIKLPPSSYFFTHNIISPAALPDHKVNVDFISNGRPSKVYHWSPAVVVPRAEEKLSPTSSPTTLRSSTTTTPYPQPWTTTPRSQTPTTTPQPQPRSPAKPLQDSPSMRTFLPLRKGFVFNGRPSGVYIWKQNSPNIFVRHRRPRVLDF